MTPPPTATAGTPRSRAATAGAPAALFLDRDGVINVDRGYVCRIEDFEFVAGIFELCRQARALGLGLFVVTNQAGIGRGLYSEQDFECLTRWMARQFADAGAPLQRVYFCPSHPSAGLGAYRVESPMRKPGPGMILQARDEFGLDLRRSLLLGDKLSDVQAGLAAGVGLNLLLETADQATPTPLPPGAEPVPSLQAAALRMARFCAGSGTHAWPKASAT